MPILKQSPFKRFRRDTRGNVAVIFALGLLPMIGFVGSAVDYSRASMLRSRIQSAVDETALKLAIDGACLSTSDLTSMANRYFGAVLDRTGIDGAPSLTVARNDTGVQVKADANVQTTFMKVLGFEEMPIGAAATGQFDQTKIELALVLDNTGSMADNNKMTELKKAAGNLVAKAAALDPAGKRLKISIVPFDTQVNVGASYQWKSDGSYRHAAWLGFRGDAPSLADAANPNAKWTGCVMDRQQPDDANGTAASSSDKATLYPAKNCDNVDWRGNPRLGRLQPLTSDWTALQSTVNAMGPSGCTNVTIGFHWGQQMLSNGTTPLSLGAAFGTPHVKKYLVLLTDGENTKNRWVDTGGCSGSRSPALIDARTQSMCDNIKAGGAISVFTIRVMDGNSTLLRSCASQPSMYYEVQRASQIDGVLSQIFNQISDIRLSS